MEIQPYDAAHQGSQEVRRLLQATGLDPRQPDPVPRGQIRPVLSW